ncbi:hypothetical protein C475_08997 [Halosimplex carlsbadense 2-9-1]|uniref:Uncharacterized protein n=1 Tax=Halosimplex carlsbadense 2-9-1 TaxID=797114 RepID=M0CTM5_9EURY|nr:hypothetical protein [Halosimplex carlsbadense]ELZ26551.1 hypothetical protein C475_08997 [Halosimplex carlsbadense 2-9-1]
MAAAAALYLAGQEFDPDQYTTRRICDVVDVSKPSLTSLTSEAWGEVGVVRRRILRVVQRAADAVGDDGAVEQVEDVLDEHGVEWIGRMEPDTAAVLLYYWCTDTDAAAARIADAADCSAAVFRNRDRLPVSDVAG